MKELSIEQKAKRYDEALERAKMEMSKDGMKNDVIARHLAETIFPELKESKDERIRKELIDYHRSMTAGADDYVHEAWIAWLEKQGEQPIAWNEEDENRINRLIAYFEDKESFTAEDDVVYANWLKSLKERVQSQPKQEWSKKDEAKLKIACALIRNTNLIGNEDVVNSTIDWLKSLGPQNKWKPSDEQMNALSIAVKHGQTDDPDALKKLLEQLKKLKEK